MSFSRFRMGSTVSAWGLCRPHAVSASGREGARYPPRFWRPRLHSVWESGPTVQVKEQGLDTARGPCLPPAVPAQYVRHSGPSGIIL